MEVLAGAVVVLLLGWWVRTGRRSRRIDRSHLRGLQLTDPTEELKGPVTLGYRGFPERLASGHFAFIGATGSGKTLLQRLLLQSALPEIGRGRGHRALLYDAKRDLPSLLAGMGLNAPVRILNPLDARSVAWDMAADISNPSNRWPNTTCTSRSCCSSCHRSTNPSFFRPSSGTVGRSFRSTQ